MSLNRMYGTVDYSGVKTRLMQQYQQLMAIEGQAHVQYNAAVAMGNTRQALSLKDKIGKARDARMSMKY